MKREPTASKPRAPVLKLTAPRISEGELQRQIKDALEWKGYVVMEVGKARGMATCYQCGASFRPRGWQGNTPGCPDLFVTRKEWRAGAWIGLELKAQDGKLRPEQAALHEAGRTYVVRSLDEALRAVQEEGGLRMEGVS